MPGIDLSEFYILSILSNGMMAGNWFSVFVRDSNLYSLVNCGIDCDHILEIVKCLLVGARLLMVSRLSVGGD